jgi:hypothetical protein
MLHAYDQIFDVTGNLEKFLRTKQGHSSNNRLRGAAMLLSTMSSMLLSHIMLATRGAAARKSSLVSKIFLDFGTVLFYFYLINII